MNFKADVATKETVINDPMMTCTTTPRSFTSRTNASAINKAQPQANPFPAISIVSSAANFAILSPMPMLEKSATASPSGRSIRHNEVSTSCHGGVASTSWITDINLPFWMAKLPHEGTLPAVCGWQVPGAKTSEQDHQRLSADSQFMPIQLVLPPKFPHEYHECATEASLQLRFFFGALLAWNKDLLLSVCFRHCN